MEYRSPDRATTRASGTPKSVQQCTEQQGTKKERRATTTRFLHFLFWRILFFVLGFSPFSISLF
jgi:hypothetical protein